MSFSSPNLCSLFKAILGYNQYFAECNENEYQEQITLTGVKKKKKKKLFILSKTDCCPVKVKSVCLYMCVCMRVCITSVQTQFR